jgi:hypothetical protein
VYVGGVKVIATKVEDTLTLYGIVSLIMFVFIIWWMIAVHQNLKAIRDKIAPQVWAHSSSEDAQPLATLYLSDVSPLPSYEGVVINFASKTWVMGTKTGQYYGLWDRKSESDEPTETFPLQPEGWREARKAFIEAAGPYAAMS